MSINLGFLLRKKSVGHYVPTDFIFYLKLKNIVLLLGEMPRRRSGSESVARVAAAGAQGGVPMHTIPLDMLTAPTRCKQYKDFARHHDGRKIVRHH